ncbi:MAG: archaeal heat shock protein Hsp20 [Asgard group archaeon]|nr:archaeal heat shock protein Hsp20 [Asgard group archaeon]
MSWRDRKDDKDKPKSPFDLFGRDFMGNEFFEEFMKEISQMMGSMDNQNPNVKRKVFGPYVRGYSVTIGPDGKPKVKKFGNVRSNQGQLPPQTQQSNESLIDVFTNNGEVKIVAEIPGVSKEDINVRATETKVKISAQSSERNYQTEKELPVKIKPKTASSKYTNGILELVFERVNPEDQEEDEFEIDIQ